MRKFLSIFFVFIFLLSFSSCRTKEETKLSNKSQKNEITMWNLFDDSDVFKGQIQAYQSKHPNVQITYRKFTNIDEYEELLVNEIAEGEGPDIFAMSNTWVDKHLKKISPFPVGKTSIPMNQQIFEDTFFHIASKDLIKNGAIYGMPLFIDNLAIYYNKKIFQDNIPNSDKPAETWDEIKKQVSLITKKNNSIEKFSLSGIAMGRADNISRATDILYGLMLEHGTQMFNDAGNKAIFSSKQSSAQGAGKPYQPFLEALSLYTSFSNSKYKNYSWNEEITSLSKDDKEIDPFLRGKTAMIFGYSYLYEDLLSKRKQIKTLGESTINEEDIGIIEFPQILSFAETGKRDALASYFPFTVSRNSKNSDIAWDFIQFLTSKDSLIDYYEKTKKPSSRKDLVEEQMLDPVYGVFARQASYSKSFPESFPVDSNFLNKVFINAIEEVNKNKTSLPDIATKAEAQVNCQLEKKQNLGESNIDCLKI